MQRRGRGQADREQNAGGQQHGDDKQRDTDASSTPRYAPVRPSAAVLGLPCTGAVGAGCADWAVCWVAGPCAAAALSPAAWPVEAWVMACAGWWPARAAELMVWPSTPPERAAAATD
jgi:hypothetical protein